jgi:hypothetical protein
MKKNLVVIWVAVLVLQSCTWQKSEVQGLSTPGASETMPAASLTSQSVATNTAAPTLTSSPTITSTPLPTATATPALLAWPVNGVEIRRLEDLAPLPGLGVYWVRRNALLWSAVEAVQGNRDWGTAAALEQELIQISQAGMQAILVVRGTPEWAQAVPGSACGPIRAENREALASFLYEAVARYSAPPYNVRYWELWNEPDVDPGLVAPTSPFGCWGDASDVDTYGGDDYADVLKVVYPRIKMADPGAQVLVGGLLLDCDPRTPLEIPPDSGQFKDCTPAKYLAGILANGGGDYFDGVSFHAYDFYNGTLGQYSNINWRSSWESTGPVLLAKADYLRELLASYGYPDKFLMNTEVALLCGRTRREVCLGMILPAKAYYAVQAYATAYWRAGKYLLAWWVAICTGPDLQPLPVTIPCNMLGLDRLAPQAMGASRASVSMNSAAVETAHPKVKQYGLPGRWMACHTRLPLPSCRMRFMILMVACFHRASK